MPVRVATWNVFHGRSVPPTRANLLPAFAGALANEAWDVCGLQEVPPWWSTALGQRSGASVRTARTTLIRSLAGGMQAAIHARDPELLKAGGAGVNALLVRPDAGRIDQHRVAVLRSRPLRRTVQAVRLVRPYGRGLWIANVHTHNAPQAAAAADLAAALHVAATWAGDERLVVLGDLNLTHPQALLAAQGFTWLHGHRVDHITGRGLRSEGAAVAKRLELAPGRTLADHRFVAVDVADA